MAKRPPKKRTAHVDDASQPGTSVNVETNLLIAKKSVIQEFCEEKQETKRRVGKINDAFSKTVEKKVQGEHLHRQAANDAYALNVMEDKELHEYLYHFLFYIKDLGLLARCTKQEELFAAGDVGPGIQPNGNGKHPDDNSETEQEDETEESDTTRRLGAAAREVAEAAGASLPKH